jgi:hypothetical protein
MGKHNRDNPREQNKSDEPRGFHMIQVCGAQDLQQVGPLVPGAWQVTKDRLMQLAALGIPEPPPVQGYMLIDTGSPSIVIDESVAKQLKLKLTGRENEVAGIHGMGKLLEYEATLFLPLDSESYKSGWYGFPVAAWSSPTLRADHDKFDFKTADGTPISVIGILGRLFLQFVTFTYDGLKGSLEIKIDESVLFPKRN